MAAKKVSIPITDHNADGVCTIRYKVRYKSNLDTGYTQLNPDPVDSPVEIFGIPADLILDVRVARFCCNGLLSDESSITVNT